MLVSGGVFFATVADFFINVLSCFFLCIMLQSMANKTEWIILELEQIDVDHWLVLVWLQPKREDIGEVGLCDD